MTIEPLATQTPVAPSNVRLWAGRIVSGLAVAFFCFDAGIKLLQLAPAIEGTEALGFSRSVVLPLGLIELACLVAYVVPRTAVVGAVLWTGYLGGAIATHLRLGQPLATHTLFPLYVAVLVWGGLYLRDARVAALLGRPQGIMARGRQPGGD